VIINDFNLMGVSVHPFETDSPLLIDADAVLSLSASPECFQPVPRRNPQILKANRGIQKLQFMERSLLDLAW
jgi:hypothetical protein